MLDELSTLVDRARALVGSLEIDALAGVEAREAVRLLADLERLAGGAKVLATARLIRTGAGPGDPNFRDVESWLASVSGCTVGAARGVVETARRVERLPATADALRAGALSPAQASLVASAASADPGAERRLLDVAGSAGVKGLRETCDRVVAAAASRAREVEQYERICDRRSLHARNHPDGARGIELRGPADRVAEILAAIEPIEREMFEAARACRQIVPPEATAFDALVELARRSRVGPSDPEGSTSRAPGRRGGRPLATVVIHVSHTAYARGWTERGEISEIEGVGPVPVGVAQRLAADCVLKAVMTDGVDVTRVAHLGRSMPAHLRTAVEARDRSCVIAGCEVDRHLEIDHNEPVAIGGRTSLENLGRICHHHHDLKTRRDLRRVGPLGAQRLVERAAVLRPADGAGRSPPIASPR